MKETLLKIILVVLAFGLLLTIFVGVTRLQAETISKAPFPLTMNTHGHKEIYVFSSDNRWAAYDENGKFVRGGIASLGKPGFKTPAGTYTFYMKRGGVNCVSYSYGGAIPYCIFFYKGYALHAGPLVGSGGERNTSHGCVHIAYEAAKWIHNVFLHDNTYLHARIVIEDYNPYR